MSTTVVACFVYVPFGFASMYLLYEALLCSSDIIIITSLYRLNHLGGVTRNTQSSLFFVDAGHYCMCVYRTVSKSRWAIRGVSRPDGMGREKGWTIIEY